jgi:hypothetical protein
MGERIGDTLVQKGLVSEEQRDEALEKQNDAGGTLGANLLELGFVDEPSLGQALAEQMRVRYAPPGMTRYLSDPARKALPRPLLWKHKAVPFRLTGDTLHLLVANVRNLSGLSTQTGYRIVPWLAPEVRVHRELQRHFKIPLSSRYAEIVRRLETDAAQPATSSTTPAPGDEAERRGEAAEESEGRGSGSEAIESSDSLRERLTRADDADDAVRIVLDHALEQLTHCILFRVKDGEARVWDVRGHSLDPEVKESFVAPAMSGSPLELLTIYPTYRGPVPDEQAYRRFFDELELQVPHEIVLLPIEVSGRLVAILYGDGGAVEAIPAPFAEQRRLARKLVLGLTMLLIQRKIRE